MSTKNDQEQLLATGNDVASDPPPSTPAGYQFNAAANSAYLILLGLFP